MNYKVSTETVVPMHQKVPIAAGKGCSSAYILLERHSTTIILLLLRIASKNNCNIFKKYVNGCSSYRKTVYIENKLSKMKLLFSKKDNAEHFGKLYCIGGPITRSSI